MPAERTTMRQVREVLRLKFVGGVPTREIARRIGVAASGNAQALSRLPASAGRRRRRLMPSPSYRKPDWAAFYAMLASRPWPAVKTALPRCRTAPIADNTRVTLGRTLAEAMGSSPFLAPRALGP
jgi:hypothetical protein